MSSPSRSRLPRLLRLLDLLQESGGQSAKELAAALSVSTRTVLRDLEILQSQEIAIVREGAGIYRLAAECEGPWGLSEDEAIAAVLLFRRLGQRNTGLPGYSALQSAAAKMSDELTPTQRKAIAIRESLVELRLWERAKPDRTAAFHDLLLEAALGRRRVRVRYSSVSEDSLIQTDLAPYRLLFARRTWYCIGHSSLHKAVRTFHLGRIGTLEPLDKPFRIPGDFSLEEYFGQAWRLIREGQLYRIVLKFAPRVARNVAEIVWHKSQSLEWLDDDSLQMELEVDGLHEISWWILGYGAAVEVMEPPELREIVATHVRAMATLYGMPLREAGDSPSDEPTGE